MVTTDRLLEQSAHLRTDVAAGSRVVPPLYDLMLEMQAERTMTAARWAGTPVRTSEMRKQRTATDRALTAFRRATGSGPRLERAVRFVDELRGRLEELDDHRGNTDHHHGSADDTVGYYSEVIYRVITICQVFSLMDDAELTQAGRPVVALFSASELLAREDMILATAGPDRVLDATVFSELTGAVGAHRFIHESEISYLSDEGRRGYEEIVHSGAWRTKTRVENALITEHQETSAGVRLPTVVRDWPAAYSAFTARLNDFNVAHQREVFARAAAKAEALETKAAWLTAGSGAGLLLVIVVVVFTTRTVLRRMDRLHRRTVAVAEKTLPDIVAGLQRGVVVDESGLPQTTGQRDEVGRISDAFAQVVAVSVEGHRQLAEERQGFGMFASGIASRTGNLVSRQLALTEDLQDTFGHDEALLARLMRSDQLTVGMRRQIENLLILTGGEIPDPHVDPMRVADLLREAAAEVEEFRRIERHTLDEVSVGPRVISQISHLLAELLDNATRFSPPASKVVIRAESVPEGLSIEIDDRGPRVPAERYDEMNGRLHSAPPYSVLAENAHRLGLFVVGHLAEQLNARVTLRRSPYGGTSAVVIIPREHLVPTPQQPEPTPAPPTAAEPVRLRADRGPELVLPKNAVRPAATRTAATVGGLPRRTRQAEAPPPQRHAAYGGATLPPLPERRPQTHIAEQLRQPRPAQNAALDTASPEEVAEAWADYEDGTQTVESELRRDQP